MAVTYVIDGEAQLIELTATGPTSVKDVSDIQAQLRADPDFRPTYRQLFDFRQATPSDIRGHHIEGLLGSSPVPSTTRRAYVVAPGVGYGMGRVAEAVAEYQKMSLRVFLDLDTARTWLFDGAA